MALPLRYNRHYFLLKEMAPHLIHMRRSQILGISPEDVGKAREADGEDERFRGGKADMARLLVAVLRCRSVYDQVPSPEHLASCKLQPAYSAVITRGPPLHRLPSCHPPHSRV